MADARKRRILKRAALAIAVAVMLPGSYLGSFVLFLFADAAELVPDLGPWLPIREFYDPARWYMQSGWIGSELYASVCVEAVFAGDSLIDGPLSEYIENH